VGKRVNWLGREIGVRLSLRKSCAEHREDLNRGRKNRGSWEKRVDPNEKKG
jgi:hypothetical protein